MPRLARTFSVYAVATRTNFEQIAVVIYQDCSLPKCPESPNWLALGFRPDFRNGVEDGRRVAWERAHTRRSWEAFRIVPAPPRPRAFALVNSLDPGVGKSGSENGTAIAWKWNHAEGWRKTIAKNRMERKERKAPVCC
jgi:hypothetical protein